MDNSCFQNEVTKAAKWYFYDNGVRNAVVNDFRLPALHQDTGQLWESYIISERIKKLRYGDSLARFYLWRNYAQQEIDFIEEENGMLRAYEIKFTAPKRLKMPNSFQQAYPDTPLQCIHREAYWDFVV